MPRYPAKAKRDKRQPDQLQLEGLISQCDQIRKKVSFH